MEDFFKTIHCTSGVHCRLCRDLNNGRHLRAAIAGLLGINVDFNCLYNKPWIVNQKCKESVTTKDFKNIPNYSFEEIVKKIKAGNNIELQNYLIKIEAEMNNPKGCKSCRKNGLKMKMIKKFHEELVLL